MNKISISLAPSDDERWMVQSPLTGPNSSHKVIENHELDKICELHKEVAANKSYFKDTWLAFFCICLGHFVSNWPKAFNGDRPGFDSFMSLGFIVFLGLFIKEAVSEWRCVKKCSQAIDDIKSKIVNRELEGRANQKTAQTKVSKKNGKPS